MKKVIRDGKVAVIYSPGYGGGWYYDHRIKELVFHPKLVELIEQDRKEEITEELLAEILNVDMEKVSGLRFYSKKQLEIEWVDEGSVFTIHEYDGYETVVLRENHDWLTA